MGAHRAGAPDAQANAARIRAGVTHMPFDQLCGELLTNAPGRATGHAAWIDGVEVPTGGQHVGHAAGGRSARSGRHIGTVERTEHIADLVARGGRQVGHELVPDEPQRAEHVSLQVVSAEHVARELRGAGRGEPPVNGLQALNEPNAQTVNRLDCIGCRRQRLPRQRGHVRVEACAEMLEQIVQAQSN